MKILLSLYVLAAVSLIHCKQGQTKSQAKSGFFSDVLDGPNVRNNNTASSSLMCMDSQTRLAYVFPGTNNVCTKAYFNGATGFYNCYDLYADSSIALNSVCLDSNNNIAAEGPVVAGTGFKTWDNSQAWNNLVTGKTPSPSNPLLPGLSNAQTGAASSTQAVVDPGTGKILYHTVPSNISDKYAVDNPITIDAAVRQAEQNTQRPNCTPKFCPECTQFDNNYPSCVNAWPKCRFVKSGTGINGKSLGYCIGRNADSDVIYSPRN